MIGSAEDEKVAAASLDGGSLYRLQPLDQIPDNNSIYKTLRGPDSPSRPRPPVKRHKTFSYSYSGKENITPGQFSDQPDPVGVLGTVRGNQLVDPSIQSDSEILQTPCRSPSWLHNPIRHPGGGHPFSFPSHSIESRLLSSSTRHGSESQQDYAAVYDDDDGSDSDFESCTQFGELMRQCFHEDEFNPQPQDPAPPLVCPLCGLDISHWDEDSRQLHANACLDNSVPQPAILPTDTETQLVSQSALKSCVQNSAHVSNVDPVVKWLRSLGLGKYVEAFIQQEIDWDSLQWLTEEDIVTIGVTALGPRKKIVQSIKELRERNNITIDQENDGSAHTMDANKKLSMNRLITEYFSCPLSDGNKNLTSSRQQQLGKARSLSHQRRIPLKNMRNGKKRDVPSWCCIPGTPFRVDAFQYLQRDCSHWFLTHFHIDHYQGLTRSFTYGKIYCSLVTAKLINAKIGIPWDRFYVMPLKQKIKIAGVDVTCFDANHCPGAIIMLFEPPNGKAVLHTGDFRFNEEMASEPALQASRIHTLILDTTYCNPQYNFPKQEVVLQFVIEAIQAESFNPKTLFLIGSYTIGKERLFLEVARVLHKKIYVTAAKLRLLECLELPPEDMQWFTLNELDSHIHVVPMWTIASFKRLKQLSYQYSERFSLVVAFTPTGWTFGKGKKSAGKRWQQGTIIRYEVPYSEHCSFEELKEFVKFISPVNIIPSVNNESEASVSAMTALLLS